MSRTTPKILFLIMLLALLVACGGNSADDTPTEAPLATEESQVEAPESTEAPEPTAATVAPTQTSAPEPTSAPTDEPEAAAPVRLGILRFSDHEGARSGAYALKMNDVPSPPAGHHYELWLVSDLGSTLNLGALTLTDGAIEAAGQVDENLIGNYSSGLISIQPDGEASSAPDDVAFDAVVPPGSLLHIRHVVFEFAGNPDGQGFILGAEAQTTLAMEHAGLLLEAMTADDLDGAKQHAEHVINILDGEAGSSFGDYTGDDVVQNPGDGLGVRGYLAGAQQHAQLAADADGATAEVVLHSGHVNIAGANALLWLDEAIDEALHVISADSVGEAQPFADSLSQLTTDMIAGRDVDGDGAVAPVEGEGGIQTAYQHGLFMGGFEIFAAEATANDTGGAVAATEAPPTSEPPPDDESSPEPVVIDMLDFEFSEKTLTIPVGTTVTWKNVGNVQHSATADDGSFDTGLFSPGGEASFTFDSAGTFDYYCILHGNVGGVGMSATIVVTDEATSGDDSGEEATATPEAPEPVTVDMLDFEFSENTLTIPLGTTVTWKNGGNAQHSATADDGSFDTGLFGPGGEASFTFESAGTFAYYCILHGNVGGVGMSATIIVTDG